MRKLSSFLIVFQSFLLIGNDHSASFNQTFAQIVHTFREVAVCRLVEPIVGISWPSHRSVTIVVAASDSVCRFRISLFCRKSEPIQGIIETLHVVAI